MRQVMLYDTVNCFFVSDAGAVVQKVFAPTQLGTDSNGWATHELAPAGSCRGGADVDGQDGYQGTFTSSLSTAMARRWST